MGKKGAGMIFQQQWQAKGGGFPAGACGVARHQELGIEAGSSSSPNTGHSSMKDPLARTKVVIRHLPPTLTEEAFVAQIEKFAKTYSWLAFHPGKLTLKNQVHSRAYINFNSPADVGSFHEEFDGHVFVNEKGTQYKALVEYAPCQRVPSLRPRRDPREGSIFTDPHYLEFLESLSKPTEQLPSADVQLERREAERLANPGVKDGPIVTPLMEFVRQKRATKLALKAAKRGPHPTFVIQKRGENGKLVSSEHKDGPNFPRRERHKRREASEFKKLNRDVPESHKESEEGVPEEEKKDWKLPREKEKVEAISPGHSSRGRFKQTGYRERTGRGTSPKGSDTFSKSQSHVDSGANGNGPEGRRLRNKDRPDRPVWTPRRLQEPDSAEGTQNGKGHRGNRQTRVSGQDVYEPETELDGRNGTLDNGTYRFRKGSKDLDSDAGRHLKRGVVNEKQVWVAKTG